MKKQTVLEAPAIAEMTAEGFKRFGMVDKDMLNDVIENALPWRQWFFCPMWKWSVEAWYRD